MAFPNIQKPFKLFTDASNHASGAILNQDDENGLEWPMHFISKSVTSPQTKWATNEKETWAVVYALGKLHPYLWETEFVIYTDHKPLLS